MNDHDNLRTHVTGQTTVQSPAINSDMRSSIVIEQPAAIHGQDVEVSPFEIQA